MWEVEKNKKGKRLCGWWVKNPTTGVVIYVARKWHKEIFRSGELTISDALRKNIACWAIDNETLQLARIKGVKFVGIKVRDHGSIYLASIDEFYNPANLNIKNHAARGGALQRYLPLENFRVIHEIAL